MSVLKRMVGVLAVLCLVLVGVPGTASAAKGDRVGGVRGKADKVRIDKAGGKDRWRAVTKATRVYLVGKRGARVLGDVDDLVRGAKVVDSKVKGGVVRTISLKELGSTGNADCSFDSDEEDGDHVTDDDSFDCSNDYDDGRLDTDTDCSYDSSRDGGRNDWSMDTSWDCSYSETEDGDRDGLEWDCSFDASADASREADGGDTDADLSFDCSWEGADTDSPLWNCKFLPAVLGFTCVSKQLDQEFAYTIDTTDLSLEGGFDFQRDNLPSDVVGDDGVNCTSGGVAGDYDCSVDGDAQVGNCDLDWSFDKSRGVRDGDVSGDLSYSCSWDNEGAGGPADDDL